MKATNSAAAKLTARIKNLIKNEERRQSRGLIMIASENYSSAAVRAAAGSVLMNKYSEGYPGRRYYTGNQFIDGIETLAENSCLRLFGLSSDKWRANVQPHSGSSANLAAYFAVLKPGDKILAMDLAQGGHLTHGSPVNFSGKLFKFVHYGVDRDSCRLDYKTIEAQALKEKPKMIVCGATAYPREIDFKKFAAIAKKCRAYLLADISHVAGLVKAGVHPSPFPYADIVTSTTHKTLGGPRSAFIIAKKELSLAIDKAIFPGLQGGPLENMIAAKALCFAEALTPEFDRRQKQTVKNTGALAAALAAAGITIVSGGSDNHLLLADLRPLKIGGRAAADLLAEAEIYTNANMIPFDPASPMNPSGLRLGTAALTARGMKEKEMKLIGLMIAELLKNPDKKQLKNRIKREVLALTAKFPLK